MEPCGPPPLNGNKYQKFKQIKFAYAAAFLRFAPQWTQKALNQAGLYSRSSIIHTQTHTHIQIDTQRRVYMSVRLGWNLKHSLQMLFS